MTGRTLSRIPRLAWLAGGVVVVAAAGAWLWFGRSGKEAAVDMDAVMRDVLSEASTTRVRTACSTCHVFPQPDILPREYWPVAVRGMFQIAGRRGITIPVSLDRAMAWYVFQAPEQLPPAPGRTDAGPGRTRWEREPWRPDDVPVAGEQRPAVTHVQMASLLGGSGLDVLVSDVSTNRVYALRPYAPEKKAVVVGTVPNPGRLAVTDLDRDGKPDLVVAALGQLAPTNDPVGSVVWFRRTGPETFQPAVLADSLGRVADVRAVDLTNDGRTDLLVAVFGWMQNGGLLWLENTGGEPDHPAFVRHVLDARPGFTDVRAVDLNRDGRLDVVALIAQEFQQVMVYWAGDDGYRPETVYQAPNPDWGYTGLEVSDFTGNGYPDIIVTNGDNLDLTVAKPFHGVGLLENLGDGRFEYRHITSMYGAHRAVPVDLAGDGQPGLLVSAWLPPSVVERAPAPREALIWLERVGPTRLVRRVLKSEGVDHMTMAVGDATGDGRPDIALGSMDLGVVDPAQAHRGPPLTSWVTLWRNLGVEGPPVTPPDSGVIDWHAGSGNDRGQ
jgi:FG-GAP-like repeat